MRQSARFLLFVACVGLVASAGAENAVLPAVAKTSFGSFEGGALHIALVMEGEEIVIYADDLTDDGPWVGRTGGAGHDLVVMSCDVSIGKCQQAPDAALTVHFKRFSRIEGHLAYTNLRGVKRDIRFAAKLR